MENLLFESLPSYHVTGNLYRPAGNGPFPAILLPCGHSRNGKAYKDYQKAAILLVRHGFIVLCFDPIGQGERRQLIGDKTHRILNPRGEHNPLGVAPILLGRSLGAMMVWDGVRALDYLCSRSDVDRSKIGCTGNSGGGNLTSYLMAYDDRILAAAPGCFMTTHRRKNEKPGPGDAEQNLFAQLHYKFDHPDFILSRAPKPTLILSATYDYLPIEGAWEAFRQAKRAYTLLGKPSQVDLIESNTKHGFSQAMRERVTEFMARWLQNRNIKVQQQEYEIFNDSDLQVTMDGQVRWLPGANSIFQVFERSLADMESKRPVLTQDLVHKVTGIRKLNQLPSPRIETIGGRSPQKLVFHPEPGIVLPALYWPIGELEPILLALGDGMNSSVPEAQRLHELGHPVLIVEVRDTGETKTRNWRFYGADSYIGQMRGKSWVAMRTEDLLVAARWLGKVSGQASVQLHASGETVPAAIHAHYLEPCLFKGLSTSGGLESWSSLMNNLNAHQHIHQAVHGALQYYDLPDIRRPE